MSYQSETSQIRAEVQRWIPPGANGIDLGFGGDPITQNTIAMDLPTPYAQTHDREGRMQPQHLHGDARRLKWFADGALDYVYSSHLLEDFENTREVLAEWFRVLRPGGKMILYLPDERKYRAHCAASGQGYNASHKVPHMSRPFICLVVGELGHEVVQSTDHGPYSFLVVAEKR